MQLVIDIKTSTAMGKFGGTAAPLAMRLEGKKTWVTPEKLRFETTQHNLRLFAELWHTAEILDKREETTRVLDAFDFAPAPIKFEPSKIKTEFLLEPLGFQMDNFNKFKDQEVFAIFSEQGTGKTKVFCDILCYNYKLERVTGLIVFSIPKGVHVQWIEEQMPKHMWRSVKYHAWAADGNRKPPAWFGKPTPELQVLSLNIDALKSKKTFALLREFARQHGAKLRIVVDESDSIKNKFSVRHDKLCELAENTRQRTIMSGTPIAKDLTDEWAQFYFLDPDIIGHKYKTTFQQQYCIMGGFESRSVIGYRNLEQFKKLTAPFIFRATKAELNLPPKIYDNIVFDMTDTQRRMIREIRDQFFSTVKDRTVTVKNGAGAILRIQQISNGFFVDENEELVYIDNPRLDVHLDQRRKLNEPIIHWCRFKEDVVALKKALKDAVTIYGEDNKTNRAQAKQAFLSGKSMDLIATPGAAGRGVDGLQAVCSTALYYSNSYNAIERWQSEDRIDRLGATGTSSYFDMIARGSADRGILANLRKKKDTANFILDMSDIVEIMESVE